MPIFILIATVILLSPVAPVMARELPPTCFSVAGLPTDPGPQTRWASLIPDVIIGFDFQEHDRAYFDDQTHLSLALPDEPTNAPVVHHHHTDSMTRWTVSLRWRPANSSASLTSARLPRSLSYCEDLLQLRDRRPRDLSEAIDLWTRRSALRAALLSSKRSAQ